MPPFSRGCGSLARLQLVSKNPPRSCATNQVLHMQWHLRSFFHSPNSSYAARAKTASAKPKSAQSKPKPVLRDSINWTPAPKAYKPQVSPAVYESATWTDKILQRSAPTLLYQGPSQSFFIAVCFSTGLLALAGAAHTYYTFFVEGIFQDTSRMGWISAVEGLSIGFLITLGALAISRPFRLIRSITAVPINGVASRQIALDIEAQPLLPFRKRGRIIRKLRGDLSLKNLLVPPSSATPYALRKTPLEQFSEDQIAQAKAHGDERLGLAGRFVRNLARTPASIFLATSKMFSSSHFRYLNIEGKGNFKLDLAGGWTLDNGRG
ncbi:MAG: hypothetical protein M1821_007497 [Bathelium mastoideum]|nr:MAG: hypothetical protein M1821_007497 [Bathelium mastoideum]